MYVDWMMPRFMHNTIGCLFSESKKGECEDEGTDRETETGQRKRGKYSRIFVH